VIRALLLAVALGAASPAAGAPQSERWGSFDLGLQSYTPDVDSEFATRPGPYELMFGSSNGWMFTIGVSRALLTNVGSLEFGVRSGYFSKSGKGLIQDPANPGSYVRAGATSSFRIVPTSLALTYRFDWAVERYRIPFAPYGRLALERYNWWITRGSGGTSEKGATNGWSATGGLAFLLDVLDPTLAHEFDRDSGVNHTYLFFEVTKSWIDDFGSSQSWDLSAKGAAYTGGLTFVF
jgi:hypothetical protein